MNYPVKSLSTVPSCTKTVTIRTDGGDVIKLKQDREVTVNGEEVLLQPVSYTHLTLPTTPYV